MKAVDETLLLEIARSPEDCFLNHKVSKAALKRLLLDHLIEVETRRCSSWSNPCPHWQSPGYKAWGDYMRARHWRDRTEVHARLTHDGYAWVDTFRRRDIRVLHSA